MDMKRNNSRIKAMMLVYNYDITNGNCDDELPSIISEELEEVELEVVEEEFSNLSICFFNSLKSDLSFDNLFFVFVFVLEKDSFKEITSSEDSAFSNV